MMEQSEVQALADKLDRLIERCRKLERDNATLRELQDDWNRERAQLVQKNDHAKHKIEAMISRLRALEHH
jgi:cell division protein ZapB